MSLFSETAIPALNSNELLWSIQCLCEHNIHIWVIKHEYSRKQCSNWKIHWHYKMSLNQRQWNRSPNHGYWMWWRFLQREKNSFLLFILRCCHWMMWTMLPFATIKRRERLRRMKFFEKCDAVYICRLSKSFIFPSTLSHIRMYFAWIHCMNMSTKGSFECRFRYLVISYGNKDIFSYTSSEWSCVRSSVPDENPKYLVPAIRTTTLNQVEFNHSFMALFFSPLFFPSFHSFRWLYMFFFLQTDKSHSFRAPVAWHFC